MYIANVFDVVYSTTLLKMKTKKSKSEKQERKKRKTKYPNFKSKNWKTISIWISFKTTHLAHSRPIMVDSFSYRYTFTARTCLVPRRLSFDENVRAKEGGKEIFRLYPSHGPLQFMTSHSRFALASAMRKAKCLRRKLRQNDNYMVTEKIFRLFISFLPLFLVSLGSKNRLRLF